MKLLASLIALFCLLGIGVTATAGEIDPTFERVLKAAAPDQIVSGVVCMKDRVDVLALAHSNVFPVRLTEQARHERVIRALQEKAAATQQPVIEFLEGRNNVQSVTPLWIANIIGVKAQPSVFYALAERADVEAIVADEKLELIRPVFSGPAPAQGRGIEPGVQDTNAPDLWNMGIKGQDTIVCNIDTGVDGDHPALGSRWLGHDAGITHEEAWFDPVTTTTFPQDFGGHGTHTMGTICGSDNFVNQVGMAPSAKWIAAATIDRVSIEQTKIDAVKSFQWCADPDGNAGTSDDVPDVCSNSWRLSPLFHGVDPGDPYFYESIDACEAAGCAVVFAAGNEGYYGGTSIGTPSDRIKSPVDVFSVGALEQNMTSRASFSSMGPSGVDNFTKKPEVMAHGDNVRSTTWDGSYGYMSGTSMACPHVAGAVALLKCAYPDATPFEVKAALLYSAVDLGSNGEDNEYGMGKIDVLAAYNYLDGMSLVADTMERSTTSGQREVLFSLHGGQANAGRTYLLLASFDGSTPGTALPGGAVTLPLNFDYLTDLSIIYTNSTIFQDFSGALDAGGNATSLLWLGRLVDDPSFIGSVLTFAWLTWPGSGYGFDFASNAWDVELVL